MQQIAALPFTTDADGVMQILLITSRNTRRWVIPKGNRIKGMTGYRAAALEAYEEAGIHGVAYPAPLGRYTYAKRKRNGTARAATVEVFPLAVTGQLTQWPEQGQREIRWFPLDQAAQAVDEPDLQAIILGFRGPRPLGLVGRARLWLDKMRARSVTRRPPFIP